MIRNPPHLCMIFEATGPFNAIGRIAMAEVEAALKAGWKVSVVANRLAESLQGRVEWLKLYNPPRGFAVKWLTARHFIKKAMGDPSRFDVIHGHQPQIADLCDIFECHYLTRAAMERGCRDARAGLRGVLARIQEAIVLRAEDRCYRRWNPATELICDSDLTRTEFDRLYGLPVRNDIQVYPAPRWSPPLAEEKEQARSKFAADWQGPVVGFLGGMSERKGYRAVLDAVSKDMSLFLVLAGPHGQQVRPGPEMCDRYHGVGLIDDVRPFYAALDVLLVPSIFEPFGLVCFEAAARGIPVIATESVGALVEMERAGCGMRWSPGEPLGPLVNDLTSRRDEVTLNCKNLVDANHAERFAGRVLSRYKAILRIKTASASAPGTPQATAT